MARKQGTESIMHKSSRFLTLSGRVLPRDVQSYFRAESPEELAKQFQASAHHSSQPRDRAKCEIANAHVCSISS